MNTTDSGTIYLIHLDTPYKHARHDLGWTTNLDARLHAHREGQGARLMEVITAAGITWRLARTWPGGRDRERAIKNRHEAPRLCPECSVPPRPVRTGRAGPPVIPAHYVVAVAAQQPQLSPYERGLRIGEQFITERAGWTAGQLAACYQYVTGPFRGKPHHAAAEQDWFRGYTEPIIRRITQIRAGEISRRPRSDGKRDDPAAGGT
jgi:predicted GIY-YIG superfamily endonuclease